MIIDDDDDDDDDGEGGEEEEDLANFRRLLVFTRGQFNAKRSVYIVSILDMTLNGTNLRL